MINMKSPVAFLSILSTSWAGYMFGFFDKNNPLVLIAISLIFALLTDFLFVSTYKNLDNITKIPLKSYIPFILSLTSFFVCYFSNFHDYKILSFFIIFLLALFLELLYFNLLKYKKMY